MCGHAGKWQPWIHYSIDVPHQSSSSYPPAWSKLAWGSLVSKNALTIDWKTVRSPFNGFIHSLHPPHSHYIAIHLLSLFTGSFNATYAMTQNRAFKLFHDRTLVFLKDAAALNSTLRTDVRQFLCEPTSSGVIRYGKFLYDRNPMLRCSEHFIHTGDEITLLCASKTPSFYPDALMAQHCGAVFYFANSQ